MAQFASPTAVVKALDNQCQLALEDLTYTPKRQFRAPAIPATDEEAAEEALDFVHWLLSPLVEAVSDNTPSLILPLNMAVKRRLDQTGYRTLKFWNNTFTMVVMPLVSIKMRRQAQLVLRLPSSWRLHYQYLQYIQHVKNVLVPLLTRMAMHGTVYDLLNETIFHLNDLAVQTFTTLDDFRVVEVGRPRLVEMRVETLKLLTDVARQEKTGGDGAMFRLMASVSLCTAAIRVFGTGRYTTSEMNPRNALQRMRAYVHLFAQLPWLCARAAPQFRQEAGMTFNEQRPVDTVFTGELAYLFLLYLTPFRTVEQDLLDRMERYDPSRATDTETQTMNAYLMDMIVRNTPMDTSDGTGLDTRNTNEWLRRLRFLEAPLRESYFIQYLETDQLYGLTHEQKLGNLQGQNSLQAFLWGLLTLVRQKKTDQPVVIPNRSMDIEWTMGVRYRTTREVPFRYGFYLAAQAEGVDTRDQAGQYRLDVKTRRFYENLVQAHVDELEHAWIPRLEQAAKALVQNMKDHAARWIRVYPSVEAQVRSCTQERRQRVFSPSVFPLAQ